MRADCQFFRQIPVAEDLDSGGASVGEARLAHSIEIDPRPFIKLIQGFHIYREIADGVAGVVEAALRDAADEGHLAALESDANGTARAGGLAFATATAGFAVPAGFALAQAFSPVLGARTGFEIV